MTLSNKPNILSEANLMNLFLTHVYFCLAIMKTYRKKVQKIKKIVKAISKFIAQTIKNYKSMKTNIKKILALLIFAIIMCSCGSTKVLVDKPAQGTQTTITVTTNNPITTEVNPNTDLLNK